MKFLFTTSQLSSIMRYPKQRKGRSRMIHHSLLTPITTYALFYNGEYLTNEQMNEAKFLKLSAH